MIETMEAGGNTFERSFWMVLREWLFGGWFRAV